MFGSWILLYSFFSLFFFFFVSLVLLDTGVESLSPLAPESFSHTGVLSLLGKRQTRVAHTIPPNMDAADLGGFKRINVAL